MLVELLHLVRSLQRSPASAAAAVVTLSLTLGASATIFAVVDAVVLTPPPFADPGALVVAGEAPRDDDAVARRPVRYATFQAWSERARSLAAIEAFDGTNLTLTALGPAERVNASDVTPGFLALLGVTPVLGRGFQPDDVAQPVVIVSHAFWRGKLAGDARVIGRELTLGGRKHTIVGVLPESFFFALNQCDIWRPFQTAPAQAARAGTRVIPVARLSSRASLSDLTLALDEVSRAASPPARAVAARLTTAIAGRATRALGLVAGAAGLAMLVAFTNLAGLLIVRSIDRRRELAVRVALGAGRAEVARQLLLEAAALVVAGIAGGILLAAWLTPAAGRLAFEQFGAVANRDVIVSWRAIGAISIVAAILAWLCGSLPVILAARRATVDVLRRGVTAAPRERALRRIFVTGEVALAFVLLASMTLLGRSLVGLLAANPGFDPDRVLATSVSLPAAIYADDAHVASFYRGLQEAIEQRLGAGSMSFVDELPLTGDRGRSLVSLRESVEGREAVVRAAGSGYFDVMGIPIVAGRAFAKTDDASAPPRVVVSRRLAEQLFGQNQPVGRTIFLAALAQTAEVVGVAGDVTHRALDEAPSLTVYLPAGQAPSRSSRIVVRRTRPDADMIGVVRDVVARMDRDLPVYGTQSMRGLVDISPGVPARRVLTATFMGFALLAVVLGAVGLFGVVAHDVARRRAELALRMALGAKPIRILRDTLGQGASMMAAGLAVGCVLSFWAARTLGALGFSGGSVDVVTVALPAAILLVAGALAVLPAARRAAHTDPALTLRSE